MNSIVRMTPGAAGAAAAIAGWGSHVQNAAMLATAYFAIAGCGHSLSPGDELRGFFWLPAGLLLATLLMTSRSEWPWLLGGAFVGDAAFGLAHDLSASAVVVRFGITALESVVGALLVEDVIRRPFRLRTARDLLWFLFLTAFVATLIATLAGTIVSPGFRTFPQFSRNLWPRWSSNAMGVLVLAPLILAWADSQAPRTSAHEWRTSADPAEAPADSDLDRPGRRFEAVLLLAATIATTGFVFVLSRGIFSPLRILLVVPVIWASLRFGLRGTTAVHLILALFVAWFTGAALLQRAAGFPVVDQIAPAQTLVSMLVVIGLALALVVQETGQQVAALRRSGEVIRRLNRLYASLSAVNKAVVEKDTADAFLDATCRILVEQGGLVLAGVGRADVDNDTIDVVSRAGSASLFLDQIQFALQRGETARGPAATAVLENRRYICNDFDADPRTVPWRDAARRFGIQASGAFPIRRGAQVWGVMSLYAGEKNYFGDLEVGLLEEIADNIRFALERFEQEMSRRQTEQALRESEERFRLAMENSPIGMAIVASDGRFMSVNPSLCRILGYSREELVGRDFQGVTHPEDLDVDLHLVQQTLSGQITGYRMEKRYVRKDGATIWAQLDVVLVRMVGGSPRYFISKIQDITQRREDERRIRELNATLEQRVAERTRELEQANRELAVANRELEAFSSSVSHDLRSPLRLIDGFSQMLSKNHIAEDDVQGREDLARIRKAAHRMGDLIDSLLRLARLTRAPLVRESVDVSVLARETIDAIRAEHPSRDVTVTIEPGLRAQGSLTLLRAVLENLLGNAWKFTSRVAKARIDVGRTERRGVAMFYVRDNGAGFNMEHSSQLFRAFHRLHDESDFPGTGIGLATVQRIIQRHGGRIEVESAEGVGTTFYFTVEGEPAGEGAEEASVPADGVPPAASA